MPYSSQLRTAPPRFWIAASSKRQTMAAPGATRSPEFPVTRPRGWPDTADDVLRRSVQATTRSPSTDSGNTWTIAGWPRCHAKCSPAGTCSASQGPRDHNDREEWVPDQLSLACMRVRGIRNSGYSLTAYRPGPSVIVTARGWVRLARVRVRASGSEGARRGWCYAREGSRPGVRRRGLASSARARSLVGRCRRDGCSRRRGRGRREYSSASASTASSSSRRTGTSSSPSWQSRTCRVSHSFRGTFATHRKRSRPTGLPSATTGYVVCRSENMMLSMNSPSVTSGLTTTGFVS